MQEWLKIVLEEIPKCIEDETTFATMKTLPYFQYFRIHDHESVGPEGYIARNSQDPAVQYVFLCMQSGMTVKAAQEQYARVFAKFGPPCSSRQARTMHLANSYIDGWRSDPSSYDA